MTRIWFTADWHLADGAWAGRPEIQGDAYRSLGTLAESLNPGDIIIAAGDLFDTKTVTSEQLMRARELINPDNKEQADIGFLFIQGQHEYQKSVPWMEHTLFMHSDYRSRMNKGFAPCYRFGNIAECIEHEGGVRVWLMDWSLSLTLQAKLDEIGELLVQEKEKNGESFDVLVLHQTCNAVMAGTGPDRQKILTSLDFRACELGDGMIPVGFDLVVVGDTHYHTEFQLMDKGGDLVRALSPGSFAQQTIAETNTGQCFALDVSTMEIDSYELYRRPYEEITIESAVGFNALIESYINKKAPDEFDIPLVKMHIYERDGDRLKSLIKACANKAHPFVYIASEDAPEEAVMGEAAGETVEDIVKQAVTDSTASEKAKSLLLDLLSANSPDEVLKEYYQAAMK